MAGTIQVRTSIQISNGTLYYQSNPTTFTAVQNLAIGPTPGAIIATQAGTNVNLSQLQTPGVCTIQNLDLNNYIEYGIWDPNTQEFYPLGEVLAGEIWAFRLSRYLGIDIGTGPGTTPSGTGKQLRLKGIGGPCQSIVSAFNA